MPRSDQHGPAQDDDLAREFESVERADRPTRADEWRDPETPADQRSTRPDLGDESGEVETEPGDLDRPLDTEPD